jgi:hypothetical protein
MYFVLYHNEYEVYNSHLINNYQMGRGESGQVLVPAPQTAASVAFKPGLEFATIQIHQIKDLPVQDQMLMQQLAMEHFVLI